MGKRKKAKAPPKKAKPKVSTVFSCPFCGGGDTCSVKLDREHKLGTITCSACQAKYTKEITPLDEAIDVYSEWIDMCAAPRAARCASPCIIACIACGCRAIRLPPPPRTAAAAHGRTLTRALLHTQVGGGEHGRGPRPRRRPAVGGGARGGRGPRGRAPRQRGAVSRLETGFPQSIWLRAIARGRTRSHCPGPPARRRACGEVVEMKGIPREP